jgi:translocator protein
MKKNKWGSLLVSILVCQGAGLIGSLATFPAIEGWYQFLNKPSFSPPNWIFGPVWTLLYTLMGIALWMVWKEGWKKEKVRQTVILFLVHLIFNSLWSVAFFGMRNPLLALGIIVILGGMIAVLIKKFGEIKKTAGYLLIPYFCWVVFASLLNFFVWRLN